MKTVRAMVSRNMKKYFRDKSTMVFSVLTVFIVTALYIFFLADVQIENIKSVLGDIEGIAQLVNSWVAAGLVCIPAVSVPLMMLCFKVDDIVSGVDKDLEVTSSKRVNIMLGYIVSAWVVGFAVTLLTFAICEAFVFFSGGSILNIMDSIKVIAILALMVFSFTGVTFFTMMFLKTDSSTKVLNSILNITLGFFLGLYVPFGMIGGNISTALKLTPVAQSASLIRRIFVDDSLKNVFADLPAETLSAVKIYYGIDIEIGNHVMNSAEILIILVLFGIVFYSASVIAYKNKKA